jgi:energy-coupling factor transporter ATP-binding protein EcfA2
MQEAIRLEGVFFRYKRASDFALKGIDLLVERGQKVALMGPSGAGKSTLCFLLNGIIPRLIKGELKGRVWVEGRDTSSYPVREMAPLVGLVFQDFETQLFCTEVELEVAFGPENLGWPRDEIRRRVDWALRLVGMEAYRGRQPATLSGGEKQRLALASVLSLDPPLLCLDEPTSDLDPSGREQVIRIAHEVMGVSSRTTVLVEHDAEEVLSLDRTVLMEDGKIVADGPPRVLLRDAKVISSHGVRPPELSEAFAGIVPPERVPLTVEEALELWRQMELQIDPRSHRKWLEGEEERRKSLGPPVVVVEDLVFGYPGGPPVLSGLTFSLHQGEFVALLGQNGSGKTTLGKHLNGLLRPQRGEVRIQGVNTKEADLSLLSRRVGYVFQNPDHQIFAETVEDDVSFGPRLAGLEGRELEVRVREVLRTVGLEEKAKWDPFALTKGERQKLAVAAVLATRPEILVFDEPTTGMDYREACAMMGLIVHLNRSGHTILMITHSMWLVARYAQRALALAEGRLAVDTTPRMLFADEQLLRGLSLRPPALVRFGNRIGETFLSPEEFKDCVLSPFLPQREARYA